MASTAVNHEFVSIVAAEMVSGVEKAVECWLVRAGINRHAPDRLGRLNAVGEILEKYKRLTGKRQLQCRRVRADGL